MGGLKASPQTENGYLMIANELFDALIQFRLSGEQRQVLDFIIRKTYGFRKKVDAIPLSQFVKATGLKKSHVSRAINALKSRNIIKGTKTGTFDATIYGINKDYRSWRKAPKKGISPKKATKGPKFGNEKAPNLGTSKDNTKDNTKDNKDIGRVKNPAYCPHKEIIELYHSIIPEMPQVRVWNDTQQGWLRARWNEDPERQCLAWWDNFFRWIRESDWLMGRTKEEFSCDLEWLIRKMNFAKIANGRYHRKKRGQFAGIDEWLKMSQKIAEKEEKIEKDKGPS